MSIGNINIQDVYAAAAMGVPVQPGLGMQYGARMAPPCNGRCPQGDTYDGHREHGGALAGFFKTMLTLSGIALGVGVVAALFRRGLGRTPRIPESPSASHSFSSAKWYKPGSWSFGGRARRGRNIPFPEESTDRLVGTSAHSNRKVFPHRGGRLNPRNVGQGRTALPRDYYQTNYSRGNF